MPTKPQPESKPPRSNELEQEAREFLNKRKPGYVPLAKLLADFAAQVEEREKERCCDMIMLHCERHVSLAERMIAAIRERSRGC